MKSFFALVTYIGANYSICCDCVSLWCYATFSGSGVPPDTEVELIFRFSLRGQRTTHWTHYRGL